MNFEIRPQRFQLCLAAEAAGSHTPALRQIIDAGILSRAEHVARILAPGDGSNLEFGSKLCRQIFQAMHREVHAAFGQRLFNLFSEHSLGADFGQSNVGNFVARSLDDFEFDFMPLSTQQRADVVGLPQGELRSAGADAQAGH